jgi:hypothetical protein
MTETEETRLEAARKRLRTLYEQLGDASDAEARAAFQKAAESDPDLLLLFKQSKREEP